MNTIDYEKNIGKNIKSVRTEKNLSQQELGNKTGISNTVISAYENERKTPGLTTVATIARALGVSIDRLYYGDENSYFINSVPDKGRQIVNSICLLWESGVLYHPPKGIIHYEAEISRLLNSLKEFENKKETYPDPESYLEILKSSVANEINQSIKDEEEAEEAKKALLNTPSPGSR